MSWCLVADLVPYGVIYQSTFSISLEDVEQGRQREKGISEFWTVQWLRCGSSAIAS